MSAEDRIGAGELPPLVEDSSASLNLVQELSLASHPGAARFKALDDYLHEECIGLVEILNKKSPIGGSVDVREGVYVNRIGLDLINLYQKTSRGENRVVFDLIDGRINRVDWREPLKEGNTEGLRIGRAFFDNDRIKRVSFHIEIDGSQEVPL
ncbi:MAG TPA: hypothetical protein VHE53_02455 [Patescibacteria group bacterium]|nr:hypothetical protein [Patescibacteria group bacterium]